ncbi:MAG TPA: hypothetical protein VGO55_10075 [Allosphingosinicella sp.]|jgi:hypothetical protein|nr:hypothetical protein [Allosphingosinicella sp.]
MSIFLLAAALGQAASPPATDRDAVCWAASIDAYFFTRANPNTPPPARDSDEERLREATGYYLGVIRTRYPTEAALGPVMRVGWVGFQRGDRSRIVRDCISAYFRVILDVEPLVRPLVTGEPR